jgi:hypothetical protein
MALVETLLSWNLPLDLRARHEIFKRRARLQGKLLRRQQSSKPL